MKKLLVYWIIMVSIFWACASNAEPYSLPMIPSYNIETGYQLFYTYAKDLEVLGHDFSSRHTWGTESYTRLKIPYVDITYINVVNDLISTDTAMLFTNARHVDVEIKTGYIVRPKIMLDWQAMDLYTWKLHIPVNQDESPGIINHRESIHRLYGGLGATVELPLVKNTAVNFSGVGRLLNQKGWEVSAGVSWTSPRFLKTEVQIELGSQYEDIRYDWGKSKGLVFYGEASLTF